MEFHKCGKDMEGAETVCPGCAGKLNTVRFSYQEDGRQSFIYGCSHCDLMFAQPVLIPELNDRQMDSVDDAELFNSSLFRWLHERLNINREISAVRKIVGRSNFSLLDIGCGTGWTTNIWQRIGVRVTGLEPSRIRGELAQKRYGFRVISCYVEELESNEMFDVVTMRHVIEHFEDPHAVLEKVGSHLHDDGLLVVVVPNINCIGRYLFEAKWSWILPWHCIFFSPASLATLVERAGFELIKGYQTPSPLWYPDSFFRCFPRLAPVSRLFDRFRALSIVAFAPIVILGYLTGLSDNITMIARIKRRAPAAPPTGRRD
jgi:SAM-dependent methyltransferase